MKILVMGLPGSGKTTLASKIVPLISAKWLNADKVRQEANDWDFSINGIERQAKRMSDFADKYKNDGHNVVADFFCPTPQTRKIFNPDYIVWVDTIDKGRFEDTNKLFIKPKKFNFRVKTKNAELWASQISNEIIKYKKINAR
jgi:adenylylsulfate kinase